GDPRADFSRAFEGPICRKSGPVRGAAGYDARARRARARRRRPPTPMPTYKITIAYDGTRFVGWQRQGAGVSIQGLLEEAFGRFSALPVAVAGAGRTDAGVHALAQVASVKLATPMTCLDLLRAANAVLPEDVRVLAVEEASPAFHARFDARSKRYRYR